MGEKERLSERLDHAERRLRSMANTEGTKIMGGAKRVWSDPKELEGIADVCKEAKDAITEMPFDQAPNPGVGQDDFF